MPGLGEILVEEGSPQAAAGVGHQRIHPSALGRSIEFVHALSRCQVDLYGLDLRTGTTKRRCGLFDGRLVGSDQKVVTLPDARFANSKPMPVEAPVTIANVGVADMKCSVGMIRSTSPLHSLGVPLSRAE